MKDNYWLIPAILFFALSLSSCNKQNFPQQEEEVARLVHLSHFRMPDNTINPQLYSLDFGQYDIILLGGDLAANTSADTAVMDSLDGIFDFGRESTCWALGNHDDFNRDLIQAYTGRPSFYTYHSKGLTVLVLDTQVDLTKFVGPQLDLIRNVLDTIEQSSHLILLHHKLAWLYDGGPLQAAADEIANGPLGDCHYCTNPNNFYTDVYPLLQAVAERGITVMCIGGDLGFYQKTFHHLTDEGIHFMATGFQYDEPDNQLLLLEYFPGKKELNWQFSNLK